MASDGNSVKVQAVSPVHGSQAQIPISRQEHSGKALPPGGNAATAPAAQAANKQSSAAAIEALVALLNRHLNDSGQPDQFRVDPNSDNKLIQQVNPGTGDVVGEFLASEFPALARSVGLSGVLVDSRA
jgi:hypothetical protein